MKRKQILRILITIIILIAFLKGMSWYQTKDLLPSVSFAQEYAQVDVPLKVTCSGYPKGTSFTYTWTIGDTVIDNHTASYTPCYDDLEHFITVTVSSSDGTADQEAKIYFSKLPVLYIDTDDGGPIYSKDYYFDATMSMQGNEQYNSSSTSFYNGAISIKGRGNSTWHADKRPYKIKLEEATDLFQMGENKHWVLLANAYDDTLMRNKIAYDLSGQLGMCYMESTWIDLVLNGEYVGNYLFCEQIRIDEERVDITKWEDYTDIISDVLLDANVITESEKTDLEDYLTWHMEWLTTGIVEYDGNTYDLSLYLLLPDEINGGLLFELDAFYDEPSKFMIENQPIQISRPKYIGTNSTVMDYAYNFVKSFYNAAYLSEDFYAAFCGEELHYSQMFRVTSLAKYFIMTEVFFNEDAGLKSTYFYKDQDCLAEMGPIWDMDYSSGGQGKTSYVYDQWQAVYYSNYSQDNQWYKGLIRDPYFLSKALEVWEEYSGTILQLTAENGPIQKAYDYILESALADNEVWPAMEIVNENTPVSYGFATGYETFITWMDRHLSWLSDQFTTLDHLVDSVGAFDAGDGVSLTLQGQTVTVSAETGDYAVFYFNGIRQTEIPVEDHSATWEYPSELQTLASDVIQVRVYSNDGIQIGSDYTDFRQ